MDTAREIEELALRLVGLPLDMFEEVLSNFTIRELVLLAEFDGWAETAHKELRERARKILKKFDLPMGPTRRMLRDTRSVMSGSVGLYICNPGPWTPGDIDFYCPEGGLNEVLVFLKKYGYDVVEGTLVGMGEGGVEEHDDGGDGGSAVGDRDMDEDGEGGHDDEEGGGGAASSYNKHVIKTIVTLQKGGADGPKLNIIESVLPCAEAPIFCFHSTVVMNAVTAKGVVCYYPDWTLFGKGVVNRASGIVAWDADMKKRELAALDKYRNRGFTIYDDCGDLHVGEERYCEACRHKWMQWKDSTSMTFEPGEVFRPSGRIYCWRLGQRPSEKDKVFWRDRGATILVQGEGDGRAILYRGREQNTIVLGPKAVYDYLQSGV